MTGDNKDVSPPVWGATSLEGTDVLQMWVSCDGCLPVLNGQMWQLSVGYKLYL